MTVNKTILIGNLGQDPEVRRTQSGTVVAKLSIATNERQKDRDGNWGDHTEWHRVVTFGKTAENAERYLKKGRQVYIEGRLRTSKWQDKDTGQDRWSTEVVCDVLRFLGGRDGSDSNSSGGSSGGYGGGSGSSYGGSSGGSYSGGSTSHGRGGSDDDIPF